ncbi:MAG TPA: 50S ribosomal protein L24 [Dehalococcoidia bacterium]|nr:50S ribosomal protein L24 [Dehalococcoidia bacterium]
MSQRVKREDTVLVTKGKDRGKTGVVQRVLPLEQRVVVGGINVIKRHMKPRPPEHPGGIVERESPIAWANVKVVCPACGKAVHIGFRKLEDGRKVRYCKKCDNNID